MEDEGLYFGGKMESATEMVIDGTGSGFNFRFFVQVRVEGMVPSVLSHSQLPGSVLRVELFFLGVYLYWSIVPRDGVRLMYAPSYSTGFIVTSMFCCTA